MFERRCSMIFLLRRCLTVGRWRLGAVFWVLSATSVHAQISCEPAMTALAFGTVVPASSLTTATATLTFNCKNSNADARAATLCFNIGEPGGAQTNPRQMNLGTKRLNFQLYRDIANSQVWGSTGFGSFRTPLVVNVTLPGNGTISTPSTATMYGRVLDGQTLVTSGYYTENYLNGDTAFTINQNNSNVSPGSCSGTTVAYFPFLVSATVTKSCTVTAGAASDIQIGPSSGVAANSGSNSGTNSIKVICPVGIPYFVGLTPSNNNTSGAGVMSGTGANIDKVPYQLKSLSDSGPIWGNTATSTVVGNGVFNTGTGAAQSINVFALAPSANFTPDSYTDTVTVIVNY